MFDNLFLAYHENRQIKPFIAGESETDNMICNKWFQTPQLCVI